MKIFKFLFLSVVVLASCHNNTQKADAYGNFEAKEIIVSSETGGKLVKFFIHEGDQIDSGTVTGIVDTTLLFIQKQQLIAKRQAVLSQKSNIKAQEEVVRVQLKNAENEVLRIENLLKDGAATPKQLDDLKSGAEVLKMQILSFQSQQQTVALEANVLEYQIEQVNEQIRRAKIINPSKGNVLVKYAEEGELVGQGKALYKLGDIDVLTLRAYVSGNQLTEIKIGRQVTIVVDAPGGEQKVYDGRLDWISATAEFTPKIVQTREERVSLVYAIKISVKNDGSLKIGMPGEVFFN